MSEIGEAKNTDRELWRGPDEGNGSYYADSVHVTEGGGIGMNAGGYVVVMSIKDWVKLAMTAHGRDAGAEVKLKCD